MTDLSIYVPTSLSWYQEYEHKMGHDNFKSYFNHVYKELMNLNVNQGLSIVALVDPKNYDLFIKICCLFISESIIEIYNFNEKYNLIRRCTLNGKFI